MNLKRVFLIWIVVLAIARTPAVAVEADQCKDILADGVFDTQVSEDSQYEYVAASRLACSDSGASLYASALLENGTPISAGMAQHKNQCDSIATTRVINNDHFAFLRTASAAIVKAWSTCMNDRSFNEPVRFGVRQRADLRTIAFSVRHEAPGGYSPKAFVLRASMEFSSNDLVPGSCKCINEDRRICNASRNRVKVEVSHGDVVEFECGRLNPQDIRLELRTENNGNREVNLAALDLQPRLVASFEVLPSACLNAGAINYWHGGNLISTVDLWNYSDSPPVLKIRSDKGYSYDQVLDLAGSTATTIADVNKNYPRTNPNSIAIVTRPESRNNGLFIALRFASETIEHRLLAAGGNRNCYKEDNLSVRILDGVRVLVRQVTWQPWPGRERAPLY